MLSVSNAAAVAANTFSNGAARIAVSRRGLEPALTGRSTTKSASLTGKRGASPAVTVFCSANPHTGASTSAPSASAPSTSASAMTSDSGEAASFRQMSPEEHWWWGTPDYLMGNWHGQWRSWKPMQSTDEIRSMKSVRKLWATSPDLSSFAHMNDWYDHQGEVSKQPPRQGVQWDMSLAEHSLPDGFCHVANSNARRYVVSRQADAIWAPLEIADGEGGIKLPFLVEFFFSRTPTARLGSMVGFEQDGAFRTSVVVEESLDTNERRPSDWVWPTWGPGGVPSLLPDQLPPVPALDDKTMVGTRTVLTRNLMVQEWENVSWAEEWGPNSAAAAAAVAAAASGDTASAGKAFAAEVTGAAAAAGFMGRVPEGDEERYAVFALPHGVVACAPRSLQLVAGRPVVYSVSWVVGEGEVKRITASWGANGAFEKVEGELYTR